MRDRSNSRRSGLTPIELLVIIAVISLLFALLIPATRTNRETMRRVRCVNNLKQIGLATYNYQRQFEVLPPGYLSRTRGNTPAASESGPGWGWGALILAYYEHPLYDAMNLSLPIVDPGSATVRTAHMPEFLCPSYTRSRDRLTQVVDASGRVLTSDLSPSDYLASAGQLDPAITPGVNDGLFFRNSFIRDADIKDGTSQTLLVGEHARNLDDASWVGAIPSGEVCSNPTSRSNRDCRPSNAMILGFTGPASTGGRIHPPNSRGSGVGHYSSYHPGACNFLMADGSVQLLKSTFAAELFRALATRAGGDKACDGEY